MRNTKPFYDLCISYKCYLHDFQALKSTMQDFGYRTLAINQFFDADEAELNKKKKKNEDIIPAPIVLSSKKQDENFILLNRITIAFSDKNSMHKIIQCENWKKYHLIAVLPKTPEALQLEIDIITFDPTEFKIGRFSRKHYYQAIERGLHFEIMYAPAILDSSTRRNIIMRSHSLHQYGKSKNIIVTSSAERAITIRSPYDVTNLGLIFGLNTEQAKCALSSACEKVLIHAEGRRIGKVLVVVETINLDTTHESGILVTDSEDSDVEQDEPAEKKSKDNLSVTSKTEI